MFVNYFRDAVRSSAFNVAAVRVLLGLMLIWKIASYDWGAVGTWPYFPLFYTPYELLVPPILVNNLWIEAGLAIVGLAAFVVGYRVTQVGVVTAFLVAHLGLVASMLNVTYQSKSLYLPALVVLLYALYAEEDELSVDAFRRTAHESLDELNARLRSPESRHRLTVLKWTLVLVSFVYFVGGIDKILRGPIDQWLTAGNMQRWTLYENVEHDQVRFFGTLLRRSDAFALFSAVGTLVLEVGFFLAVVAGLPIAPFVVGLAGMHALIAVSMNPFFVEQFVLLALFAPWDRLFARTVRDRRLTVVYDPECRFCLRSLSTFESLDVTDSIDFRTANDAPERLRTAEGVGSGRSVYAFDGDEVSEGYDAFRELLAQFRLFAPVGWLLDRGPVESAGARLYRHLADGRHAHAAEQSESDDVA